MGKFNLFLRVVKMSGSGTSQSKRSIITDSDGMVVEVEVIVRVVGVRLFRGEERTKWIDEDRELRVRIDDQASLVKIEEALGKAYPEFKWSWADILPNNDIVFRGERKDK
jgi:hypothetical protein